MIHYIVAKLLEQINPPQQPSHLAESNGKLEATRTDLTGNTHQRKLEGR